MITLLADNLGTLVMSVIDLWRVVPVVAQGSESRSSSGITLHDVLNVVRVLVVVTLLACIVSRLAGLVSAADIEERLDRLSADDTPDFGMNGEERIRADERFA